jgi:seryl-tRNA synthetase
VDKEPVTSLQRKRRRISEMGLSSQNADQGDGEEIYLRSELRKMTQRVEELTKELKEVHRKYEEKTETLVGIIERLTQQSK